MRLFCPLPRLQLLKTRVCIDPQRGAGIFATEICDIHKNTPSEQTMCAGVCLLPSDSFQFIIPPFLIPLKKKRR